jgi:hypothetical protein
MASSHFISYFCFDAIHNTIAVDTEFDIESLSCDFNYKNINKSRQALLNKRVNST